MYLAELQNDRVSKIKFCEKEVLTSLIQENSLNAFQLYNKFRFLKFWGEMYTYHLSQYHVVESLKT